MLSMTTLAFVDNNRTLQIKDAVYTRDTGAYKCKARNTAGVGQDIATVFIENSRVPTYQSGEEGLQGEHPFPTPTHLLIRIKQMSIQGIFFSFNTDLGIRIFISEIIDLSSFVWFVHPSVTPE